MTQESKFPQKYNAQEKEKEILKFWEDNKIYSFNENTSKPIFSIDTPPPTMSGKMHAGHAFSYTQTDFIARYKRMNGFEVFYPFGTDDNGLPTENLVQKEKKVDLRKVSREEAFQITNEYLENAREDFVSDWKNLGVSADFENLKYSTIDTRSRKISQTSFIKLYNKDLIEQREGPVLWDRKFQTAIAQAELEDIEREAFLNYVKAKIEESENTYVIYATTRPELCFGVVGASVQDVGDYVKLKVGDEFWICGSATYEEKFSGFEFEVVEKLKGQDLIGQKIKIPVVNKVVEISHDIAVKADFGTGIAYFCTYGGLEDKEWVSRHGVTPISVLNIYGKLNDIAGKYSGMLAENARKEIITDMEESGDIIKKEKKKQIVNVGERSGVEVEYIVTKQWYAKYLDKKEHFFEQAQKFNWKPEFMKNRLESWIEGLNWDWGFSRQRHFGIPIPIWTCSNCSKHYLPEESQLPVDPTRDKAPVDNCECGGELVGESDVLDTWFTSASSTHLALSNIKDEKLRAEMFPMSLRPQAHDIINFWLFYSMAKSNLIDEINPFDDVAVSGWLLDPQGKKMSKSKGNGVSPQEVVSKFSNDALRFMSATSKLGYDLNYQEKEVKSGLAVANKIFNATKFTDMLIKEISKEELEITNLNELRSIDRWILSKLQGTIKKATAAFENYDYSTAKKEFENFFMRDLADNYIEIVKQRLWKPEERGENECRKAQKAQYFAIYNAVRGLAPFMPFVTEEVYQDFFANFENEKSIHLTTWPKVRTEFENVELQNSGESFVSIVAACRKFKSEKQVSMKTQIKELIIECSNQDQEFIEDSIEDLKAVTGSIEIKFESAEIETGTNNVKVSIKLLEE